MRPNYRITHKPAGLCSASIGDCFVGILRGAADMGVGLRAEGGSGQQDCRFCRSRRADCRRRLENAGVSLLRGLPRLPRGLPHAARGGPRRLRGVYSASRGPGREKWGRSSGLRGGPRTARGRSSGSRGGPRAARGRSSGSRGGPPDGAGSLLRLLGSTPAGAGSEFRRSGSHRGTAATHPGCRLRTPLIGVARLRRRTAIPQTAGAPRRGATPLLPRPGAFCRHAPSTPAFSTPLLQPETSSPQLTPTQADLLAVIAKVNELLDALRR